MATINASSGSDIIVPSNDGDTYRGLGGDDTYIISNAVSGSVTIVDTNGANVIQLVDGLSIASSKFASDSVQLTLSNGAVVTVNGADQFTFDVGGNKTSGTTGSSNTYAELASAMGVSSLPTGSTISDGTGGTISGTGVTSGATSYSLSASTNSVAEGSAITYTITANAAATADTTFTYNVAGDTNGDTVDKAGSGDTDSLSGTVTLASGATTATFTVTASADTTAEGLEGIKVSVFDGSNVLIGSQTALISNNADLEKTVTNMTTAIDEITGGAGTDVIGGTYGTDGGATTTSYAPGDVVDGAGGSDTLKLSIAGTSTGASDSITGITLKNIETIDVTNFETDETDTTTIESSLYSGVETVGLVASSSSGDTLFTNLPNLVNVNYKNSAGDLNVGFQAAVVAGSADAVTLNLNNNVAGGTVTLASIESVTVNAGAVKSTLAGLAATSATSLTLAGATKTTITAAMGASLKTIDLTAQTGGADITVATTATLIVTGGPGDDTINFDSSLNSLGADIFSGGAGTDTVEIDDAATLTATATAGLTGIEVLAAGATDSDVYDLAKIAGADTFRVLSTATADGTGVTVKNLTADAKIEIQGTEGVVGTLALNTSDDTANVTIATASGLGVILPTAGTITLNEFETINITSGLSATDTDDLTSSALNKVTFSGYGPITTNIAAAVLTEIDASGMFGVTNGLTMEGNTGGVLYPQTITGSDLIDTLIGAAAADTINGNGGADIINGAASVDTINGGAGNDVIDGDGGADILSGGAGNDRFLVDDDTDFITLASAEVLDGGEGTDTLRISDTNGTTIASTDLHGLKSVEVIQMTGEAALNITLDDTLFTNNGVSDLTIQQIQASGVATAAGALTVTASALTSANSITANLNPGANIDDSITGGAGDDTITYLSTSSAASGLEATDTVTGGKGTDTLAITMDDTDIGTASTYITISLVTGIEKITLTNVGTNSAYITLTDGQFVTAATAAASGNGTTAAITGVIDGSSWTGSGGIFVNASAEDDSKITMTGGAGADTLIGGAKANTIDGGLGADTLSGGAAVDTLIGGAGVDTFNMSDVSDFIGLTAAETLDGGAGSDILKFSENATTTVAASDLQGMSSVEKIQFAGTGANTITLSDSVYTNNGTTLLKIYDTNANGAVTVDAAGLSAANAISYYSVSAAATTDTITGGAGDDLFYFYEDSIATADTLVGGTGTDTLAIKADGGNLSALTTTNMTKFEVISLTDDGIARALPITLTAGFFQGTTGTLSAGTVKGVVTFNGAAETLTPMTITTGIGADIITGGAKADTIKSGTGADVIDGTAGADIITLGAGADDVKYDNSSASGAVSDSTGTAYDVITDFLSGTDEFKITVDYSSLNSGVTVNATVLTATTSKTLAQDSLSGKRLEAIYNTTDELLYINYNEDNLITTSDWTIKVNAGATAATTVASADFDFTITGTSSADTITTGAGDDIIDGGSGVDTINGGDGANTISDSAGADVVYISNSGTDTVDASTGSDDIKITSKSDTQTLITITDTSGTTHDFTVSATSHDQITNFSTTADDIKITGALYTAVAVGKTAPTTTILAGSGQTGDLDAGGVIIANTNEKMGNAYTTDFGDVSAMITAINLVTGSDGEANEEYVIAIGDSGTVYGLYYWKDVDGDDDISSGDIFGLLATVSGSVLVAADIDAASGS
jgi:Ca2+-binding RTX toxin-like protein